jgi:hypothetical protein
LWTIERVGAPVAVPDGKLVAYNRVGAERREEQLQQRRVARPRRREAASRGGSRGTTARTEAGVQPRRKEARVSYRSVGTLRRSSTWLPLDGGEAERLTNLPVGVDDPKWFRTESASRSWHRRGRTSNDDWDAVKSARTSGEKDKVKAKISEKPVVALLGSLPHRRAVPHVFPARHRVGGRSPTSPRGLKRYMGLMELAGSYDIAPDGKEIAFLRERDRAAVPRAELRPVRRKASGGDAVNLTAVNAADDSRPRYTPDGRSIVYGRANRVRTSTPTSRAWRGSTGATGAPCP